jgi:hypothetical protein
LETIGVATETGGVQMVTDQQDGLEIEEKKKELSVMAFLRRSWLGSM